MTKRKKQGDDARESINLLHDVMLANADVVKAQLDMTREDVMASPEVVELGVLTEAFEESLRANAAMFGQIFTVIEPWQKSGRDGPG